MKKNIKYLLIFTFLLFIFPINGHANSSMFSYNISTIKIINDRMAVSGWAYFTFQDFCNIDNPQYEGYEMTNLEEVYDERDPNPDKKPIEKNVSHGVANRCSGKGYNSVIYRLVLQPNSGNAPKIYSKSTSGSMQNMRREGVSATCINYWKPSTYDKKTGIGYAIHCDGAIAEFGEFPNTPINYGQRNFNVNYTRNGYWEGTYFYDDVGFAGVFDLNDMVENVEYTLYVEIVRGGYIERFPVAAPGKAVSSEGRIVKSKNSEKITLKSQYYDYFLNYSPDKGVINQDAGTVYYLNGNQFFQLPPGNGKGGGYFTSYLEYDILSIKESGPTKNSYRLGSFDFYQLGTTGKFKDDYTEPGKESSRFYAASPWVSFSGVVKISKKKTTECGGTEPLSDDRKSYCSKYPKPDDYDDCCICGGTLPDTDERKLYCAMEENQNDTYCCDNKRLCPPTTDDKLVPVTPTKYTYWNLNAKQEETSYRVVSENTSIKDYPKYCAATDETITMVTTDDMLLQYNNTFCYQKGSFTSNSPNKKDYILTYAGGSYSLNVKYNTQLACVNLEKRIVKRIDYYDQECSYRDSSTSDDDLYFLDDSLPSGFPTLDVNKNGKFDIESLKPTLEKIPTIYLSDTTSNQKTVDFDVDIKFSEVSSSKYTGSSLVYNHIKKLKEKDKSFTEPLGGKQSDINTSKTFVRKVVISKDINKEVGEFRCSTLDANTNECTPSEVNGLHSSLEYTDEHYYGKILLKSELLESKEVWNSGYSSIAYYSNKYKYWYEGTVTKTMYVTLEDEYYEDVLDMEATYTIPAEAVPSTIRDRFESGGEKYISQVNLSDYYQITMGAKDYNLVDNQYFGVAGTWNMDKTLCALDVTDHKCDPGRETCACKYDDKGNLERGLHYTECMYFRVVSVTSLFPGRGLSLCVNPTSNCRQPGRNWLYVSNDFKRADNFDYIKDKPMYHITLNPSTMNKIASNYKEYYTNIDLGSWYDPSKCTYNGNSRCSSDYESSILNGLGKGVFTRNYDIINTRYRTLKNMDGVNIYETSKIIGGD